MGSELTITWNVPSPSKNDRISESITEFACSAHLDRGDGNFSCKECGDEANTCYVTLTIK